MFAFVSKEEEELVLGDGSADASSVVPKLVIHADRGSADAPELVEGIQSGFVVFKETATMQAVGSRFGNHFDLGAAIAAILGFVGTGEHLDFGDGFLRRRNHCGPAMLEA